uniref:Putative secreted protein n=1 Tax=Rhipicephalus microplus TaxID=6941 RepID=A0A6G5A277_RHIMP
MKKMLHLHSFPFFLVPVILSTPYSDKNAILRTTFIKLGSSPFSPPLFLHIQPGIRAGFFSLLAHTS